MGNLFAYIGGVASVYLLIYLQDGGPGLRKLPSLFATLVFGASVLLIAGQRCAVASATPRAQTPSPALATSFAHMTGPYAKWNGANFACGKSAAGKWGTFGGKYKRVKMNGGERCVAHRRLRCGTLVELRYQSLKRHGGDGKMRRVLVPVCDRGPYWAVIATCRGNSFRCWKRGQAQVKLRPGYRFMNYWDITALAAKDIRFPGMGMVRWRIVPRVLRELSR